MDLSRVLDLDFEPITLPRAGLVINERVAQILRLRTGDVVEVEVLEGRRGVRLVPVTEVIRSYFGLTAFMHLDALDELMYGPRLTGVHIAYDAGRQGELFTAIKATPGIGSIALQRHALARFRETIAQNINYSVTIYVTLAVDHRLRRRLQQRPHPALRARARAGEPARAGLHAGRGVARPAQRACAAHPRCHSRWAGSSATASAGF